MQNSDMDTTALLKRLDWDDLRVFLEAATAGSFKAAAANLGLATNTVRLRILRLEDVTGAQLLDRTHHGVTATESGQKLLAVARGMANASKRIAPDDMSPKEASSRVKLNITEGLGTFWMVPQLAQLMSSHPDILISLDCSMTPPKRISSTNEVSLQLVQPSDADVVCKKIGSLHLVPFASTDYIKNYGIPKSIVEARSHRLVLQVGEQMNNSILSNLFGESPPPNLIAFETNSSSAHYWAISKGIGIGMLPTYARAITRTVHPLDIGFVLRRDIWLSHLPVVDGDSSVNAVIEWILRSFDSQKYPWFSDDFVHPTSLDAEFEGTNVVRLFAGFMDLGAKTA